MTNSINGEPSSPYDVRDRPRRSIHSKSNTSKIDLNHEKAAENDNRNESILNDNNNGSISECSAMNVSEEEWQTNISKDSLPKNKKKTKTSIKVTKANQKKKEVKPKKELKRKKVPSPEKNSSKRFKKESKKSNDSSNSNLTENPSSPYDIRNRPRRSINLQATALPETNNQNESDDESEDEDFDPLGVSNARESIHNESKCSKNSSVNSLIVIDSEKDFDVSKTDTSLNKSKEFNDKKLFKKVSKKQSKPKKEPKKSNDSSNSNLTENSLCNPSSPYDIRKRPRRSTQPQQLVQSDHQGRDSSDESEDEDFDPLEVSNARESIHNESKCSITGSMNSLIVIDSEKDFDVSKTDTSLNKSKEFNDKKLFKKVSKKQSKPKKEPKKSNDSSNSNLTENSLCNPSSPYDIRKRPRRSTQPQQLVKNDCHDLYSTDESEDEDFDPLETSTKRKSNKISTKNTQTSSSEDSDINDSILDHSNNKSPNIKPKTKSKPTKQKKVSIDINGSISNHSNSETNSPYNILDRPKRSIHSKPITARIDPSDDNSEDSEDDDDFDPTKILNDKDLDNFLNKSSCSFEIEVNSEGGSDATNDKMDSDSTEEETLDSKYKKLLNQKNESNNKEKNINGVSTTKKKYSKKLPKLKKEETNFIANDESKVKKRKYIKKKSQVIMSDGETQKFIKSFKNSNILQPSEKSKLKALKKSTSPSCQPLTTIQNSGPYIKRSTHQENSSTFSTFSVYQSRNNFEDGSHKRIVITKEKIPPIIDQHSLWRCVFCHNKEKCIDGLGELFGPYRIDKSLPEDLTIEYKNDKLSCSKIHDFKEVWFHDACLIWTPNIFLKGNQIKGISSALEMSSRLKCTGCKKLGATLMCHKHGCKKLFHYPCAVSNESSFIADNFIIYCKMHKVSEGQP